MRHRPRSTVFKAVTSLYAFWTKILGKKLLFSLFGLSVGVAFLLEQVL
jgi:hypothetical protein